MSEKEHLLKKIEALPDDLVDEVENFVSFLLQRKTRNSSHEDSNFRWSSFSLDSGSFDFWNDPDETDYTPDDLKEKS